MVVFQNSFTCQMPQMGPAGSHPYVGVGDQAIGSYNHIGKSQFMDLEVIWNYQYPSIGECEISSGTNCTYSYTWDHTPVMSHDYTNATAGEVLTLDLMGWRVDYDLPVHGKNTSRNFKWFCGDDADPLDPLPEGCAAATANFQSATIVSIQAGNGDLFPCSNVEFAQHGSKHGFNMFHNESEELAHDLNLNIAEDLNIFSVGNLTCKLPDDLSVGNYPNFVVKVGNYGYALLPTADTIEPIKVYHTITGLSHGAGSTYGGTELVITGDSFKQEVSE